MTLADGVVSDEPTSPTASAVRSRGLTLLQVAVSTALLVWLLRGVGADSWQALRSVSIGAFLVAVAAVLTAQIFTSLRLRALLGARGVAVSARRTFALTMAGYFASNFLPGTIGGDILKGAVLVRDGAPRRIVVTALLLDRLLNLLAMVALGVASLALGGLPLTTRTLPWHYGLGLLIAAVALAVVALAVFRKRAPRAGAAIQSEIGAWAGAPATIARGLFWSFLAVFSVVTGLWRLFLAVGLDVSLVSVCALLTAANLISIVPVSLNGLGVQEVSVSYLLTRLGAPPTHAVGAALLVRLVTLAASAFGAVPLARLRRRRA